MTTDYAKKVNERLRAAFNEVMVKGSKLIEDALADHHDDLRAIFLRDRTLSVSLGLGVELSESGQVEVALTTGYVKEKVKDKTTARVTPGQIDLPGVGVVVDVGRPEDFEPKMLGAGEPILMPGTVNPFVLDDQGTEVFDVASRLDRVKEFDPEQLRAVVALPGCQKTVVKAAERRLRKLAKEAMEIAPQDRNCDNCLHGKDFDVCNLSEEIEECSFRSAWKPVKGTAA